MMTNCARGPCTIQMTTGISILRCQIVTSKRKTIGRKIRIRDLRRLFDLLGLLLIFRFDFAAIHVGGEGYRGERHF